VHTFYEIFNNNTPSLMMYQNKDNNKLYEKKTFFNEDIKLKDCNKVSLKLNNTINASIMLFKPDKKLCDDYFKFMVECS
jgi:hypothetical protein